MFGEVLIPWHNAVLFISLLQTFNLMAFYIFGSILTDHKYYYNFSSFEVGVIFFIVLVINSLVVFWDDNFKNIPNLFKDENSSERFTGILKAIGYVVISVGLIAAVLVYYDAHPISNNYH